MKKYLKIIFLIIACSCSLSKKDSEISSKAIIFAESSGKIEMAVDRNGNWLSITSVGSSALLADDDHAIEQAFNAATLRAKAYLAEFLYNEIKSEKSTSTIISLFKEVENKESFTSKVVENISSHSKFILKGVYIVERKVSDDKKYVYVKIKTDLMTNKAIKSYSK